MELVIRGYTSADLPAMVEIWNQVVEEGLAFPQEEFLDLEGGRAFFAAQSHNGVAVHPPPQQCWALRTSVQRQLCRDCPPQGAAHWGDTGVGLPGTGPAVGVPGDAVQRRGGG